MRSMAGNSPDLKLSNLSISKVVEGKPFQVSFEVTNKVKEPKPFQIYLYIDNRFVDVKIGIIKGEESKKLVFDVEPNYYTSNSKEIVITTENPKQGVLITIPLEFSDQERSLQENYKDTITSEVQEYKEHSSRVIKRIKTGIKGLDDKMEGGFVVNSINLITGKTGTGKTAFCASFLYQGAKEGIPGVYITTEERKEDLKGDIIAMFGWDFEDLERKGIIQIISLKPIFPSGEIENMGRLVRSYITNLLNDMETAIKNTNSKRVVIDSVSIIEMFIKDEYMARVALASILNTLREMNVTTLITGTVPETSEGLSGGGIIEFLVDSVIKLEFMPIAEEYKRTLTIRKMRRTNHSVKIIPFEITSEGLELREV